MAARIPIHLRDNPHEVIVGNGILRRAGDFISTVLSSRVCALVTDSNVDPLYGRLVEDCLGQSGFKVTRIVVPAGENSKCLRVVTEVCERLSDAGLDRGSFVVALGGGVIGDLAGFVASIYFRGIPYVQLPTTVVAQVDSSVGGKTGVNTSTGKNLIGRFHQPAVVIADPATLETLPRRELNEGFAEIIKHAAIRDPEMLDLILDFDVAAASPLIARNVKIKGGIVSQDEFETEDLRALLNFGHTTGHAVESVAGYGKYLHGEAVSLGLAVSLRLSVEKAGLAVSDAMHVLDALEAFDLPVRFPPELGTDALLRAMARDKKFESGAIRFVLLSRLGTAFVSRDVTDEDIRRAIDACRA